MKGSVDFGATILILALFALSAGCSSTHCIKQVAHTSNSSGSISATLELSGCGGATVGYITDLKLTRTLSDGSEETKYVWTAKGKIDANLRWIAPNELKVSYLTEIPESRTVLKLYNWAGTTIRYAPGRQ